MPGGQLIQATDQYVAVRGARLVLIDDDGVRAPAVASWLRQMGWDACVLEGGVGAEVSATPARLSQGTAAALPQLTPQALAEAQAAGAMLIDVRPSMAYRALHIASAIWSIRPLLSGIEFGGAPVVMIGDDTDVVRLAARELAERGIDVSISISGPDEWRAAGLALRSGDEFLPDARCIDFLFFVHDRHSGNKAAARQYLAWETDLVHQIDEQERAVFRFPT